MLRAWRLVGAGLIAWGPHGTPGRAWALRLGRHRVHQAQRPRHAPWGGLADGTIPMGCTQALIVLRVPVSTVRQGNALTLPQVEGVGLRLGETWTEARVKTVRRALCMRWGWPAPVGSACGSERTPGIVATVLAAPRRRSWISAGGHGVANALPHAEATWSLFQPLPRLGTRRRQRLQPTRCALLLPPHARATGRWLRASRQAAWGLHPLAYVAAHEREASPDVSALAQALRGLTACTLWLMPFGRTPTGVHQVMKLEKTHGWRAAVMHAAQETRGA